MDKCEWVSGWCHGELSLVNMPHSCACTDTGKCRSTPSHQPAYPGADVDKIHIYLCDSWTTKTQKARLVWRAQTNNNVHLSPMSESMMPTTRFLLRSQRPHCVEEEEVVERLLRWRSMSNAVGAESCTRCGGRGGG